MSANNDSVNRRDFLKTATAVGSSLGLAGAAFAARPAKSGRVIGANDRINIGVIGCGGRGTYVASEFAKAGARDSNAQIIAVCDVYEKRKKKNQDIHKVEGYLDYRELLARNDVDAVIVATPDTGMPRLRSLPWIRARMSTSKSRCATPTRRRAS